MHAVSSSSCIGEITGIQLGLRCTPCVRGIYHVRLMLPLLADRSIVTASSDALTCIKYIICSAFIRQRAVVLVVVYHSNFSSLFLFSLHGWLCFVWTYCTVLSIELYCCTTTTVVACDHRTELAISLVGGKNEPVRPESGYAAGWPCRMYTQGGRVRYTRGRQAHAHTFCSPAGVTKRRVSYPMQYKEDCAYNSSIIISAQSTSNSSSITIVALSMSYDAMHGTTTAAPNLVHVFEAPRKASLP